MDLMKVVTKPDWGLLKTIKLNYKEIKENDTKKTITKLKKDKKRDFFRKVSKKFGKAKIVKVDFTNDTTLILLCNFFII